MATEDSAGDVPASHSDAGGHVWLPSAANLMVRWGGHKAGGVRRRVLVGYCCRNPSKVSRCPRHGLHEWTDVRTYPKCCGYGLPNGWSGDGDVEAGEAGQGQHCVGLYG